MAAAKGRFDLTRALEKISVELEKGEHVILDTVNLLQEHARTLQEEIIAEGWGHKILWFP